MAERDQVRPGPGGVETERLVVRVTVEQKNALRAYASARNEDVSTALRRILSDLLLEE